MPTPTPNFSWTEDAVAIGHRMRTQGYSFAEIGVALGCSRSAVIGKAHRQGWDAPPARTNPLLARANPKANSSLPVRRIQSARTLPALLPKNAPALVPGPTKAYREKAKTGAVEPKSIVEIGKGECRYCVADDPFRFCAEACEPGLPYCAGHARLAFNGLATRRPYTPFFRNR